MKQYIRLDPLDEIPGRHNKPQGSRLTEQEKTARLYALAEKLNVKIGAKR